MEKPVETIDGWEACPFCKAGYKNNETTASAIIAETKLEQQQQQRKRQLQSRLTIGCGYYALITGKTLCYCPHHKKHAHIVALALINLYRIRSDDSDPERHQKHYDRVKTLYYKYIPNYLP